MCKRVQARAGSLASAGARLPTRPTLDRAVVRDLEARIASQLERVQCRADREDLAQAAWLRLLEVMPRFEHRSALTTFAAGVTRRVASEVRRRDRAERRRLDAWPLDVVRVTMAEPEPQAAERHMFEARLGLALHTLSPRDRWLLLARADGATYAACLGRFHAAFGGRIRSVEGLRTAVFHARRRLVRAVIDAGGPPALPTRTEPV